MNMLLALGVKPPAYAHLPMILGADGTKLSKRHGAVSVLDYRDEGFLPEALLNYLARLGWSHGDQELFSIEEMIRLFDISDVNKSASAFDGEKLKWLNQQHLMRAAPARIAAPLRRQLANLGVEANDGARLEAIIVAQRERAKTLKEMAASSLFFFRRPATYDEKAVRKHVTPDILAVLAEVSEALGGLSAWTAPAIHAVLADVVAAKNISLGKLAQPIRIAMSGVPISPPIDATLEILGREEALSRLAVARAAWGR
jgi:glutamyl-tRNA synthetase